MKLTTICVTTLGLLMACSAAQAKDLFQEALVKTSSEPSQCRIAEILFGQISFDILPHEGETGSWESAIIRSAAFDDLAKPYGAITGEISVDRGGFAVRMPNQEIVGLIGTDLKIDGWDDVCATSEAEIVPVRDSSFIILNGDMPVGTIKGRLPAHDFELTAN